MSDDTSKKNRWIGIIERIVIFISAILVILASILPVKQLLEGKLGLLTVILPILAIVGLWASLLYIYVKLPTYAKWVRRFAFIGIVAVPILAISGYAGWKYYQSLPSDKIIILVADFDGPEPKKYAVTRRIVEQLNNATKEYDDVRIQPLGEVITYREGGEHACKIGKRRKATIVLWGEYSVTKEKVQVTVNFEVLRGTDYLPLPLQQKQEILLLPVSELESFKIQTVLSDQMSYVTLLTTGLSRLSAGDFDGAIARFGDAIARPSVPDQIIDPSIIYIFRAIAYVLKGNFDLGSADLEHGIRLKPDLYAAYNLRGFLYFALGDLEEGITDYNKTIELSSDTKLVAAAYIGRGTIHMYKQEIDLSIVDYNKAIELEPSTDALITAYSHRGFAYSLKGDFEHAISDINRAIKLNEDDYVLFSIVHDLSKASEIYLIRSSFYSLKGETSRSIDDINQAIKYAPKFLTLLKASIYLSRGSIYDMREEYELAIHDYKKAIEFYPELSMAYFNLGVIYAEKGEYDPAIENFSRAIELRLFKFSDAIAYYNRGLAYSHKGEYDLAISDFTQTIKLKPDDVNAYSSRGLAHKLKGEYDLAIADYTRSIEIDPKDETIFYNRGNAYALKSEWDLAIADYAQAIKLKPNYIKAHQTLLDTYLQIAALEGNRSDVINARAYYNRGTFYIREGNLDLAIADFNQSFAFQPDYAKVYYDRGTTYANKGDLDSAIADYNQAIKFEPDYVEAYNNRGSSYYLKGEYGSAIADFDQAIKLKPDEAMYYYNRGVVYIFKDNFDRMDLDHAIADFNQAIKLKPDYAEAYMHRGFAYKIKGDKDHAIADFRKVFDLTIDPYILQEARKQLQELGVK
ncbi:MAG: tetratricopeptide repeat protein [Thermodesulfobacteriota bacterium]